MLSISVAIVCSLKVRSQILSFKICEELSAVQTPEEEQIRDKKLVCLCRKSGQFVKDFSVTESVFFLFYYKP